MSKKPTSNPPIDTSISQEAQAHLTSFASESGCNLSAKGCNQACNQNEEVASSKMPKGCNQENDIWLLRKEVEELLGISHQALIKAIKKGRFKVTETTGNGGRQYRIALSSLPDDAQIEYLRAHCEVWQEAMKMKLSQKAIAFLIDQSLPKKEKDEDNERKVRLTDMDKAWAVKEYLKYGTYAAAKAIAEKFGVNVSTVYRWVKNAEEEAEKVRMLSVEGQSVPIRFPRTQISQDALIESLSLILSSQGKRLINGWQYIVSKGYDISYSQYTRVLQSMTPPFEKILSYHRSGRISSLLSQTPKIIRSWSELPVMSTVVGDQHYLDYIFYSPELERPVKVQFYLWADTSSRAIVSCLPAIGQQYTQWHVQASLAEVFRIHIPNEIYTDWGKQENSRLTSEFIDRLASGRIFLGNWDDFLERYPEERITRKHSTPLVPPVKPIENLINRFVEYLNQEGINGYHKRDLVDPFRSKEIQDKLKLDIKRGNIPTLEEGLGVIAKVIEKCNTTQMNTKEGKRIVPLEFLWNGLKGRRVVMSDDEIALIFFPAFVRKVRNASVQVKIGSKTVVFTAQELTWVRDGEEVMIKVNPFPPHEGSVFFRRKNDDWEFFAKATAWIGFGVDPREKDKLQKAMEVKNHYLKQFALAMRKIQEKGKDPNQEKDVARKFTNAAKFTQVELGELSYLDLGKKGKKDKNWEALGKLAEIYDY